MLIKVGVITTSFGAISHSFIRSEVEELRNQGIVVDLYAIHKESSDKLTLNDVAIFKDAVYLYPLKWRKIIFSNLTIFFRNPILYCSVLIDALLNEERDFKQHFKIIYHFFLSSYFALHIKSRGINHVHAHFMNVAATLAMFSARLSDLPYSITNHSGGIRGLPHMIILREKIKHAKFLCAISNFIKNDLNAIFPCIDKTQVVHCGIKLGDYPFNTKHIELIDNKAIRLIGVGRFVEFKGFKFLIEAVSSMVSEGKDIKLVLIGDGRLRGELQSLVESKNLSDRVLFTGFLSQDEIKAELAKSDVFVVPSIEAKFGKGEGVKEGIPVVIMEAMALGVPVIGSNYSGIPEIIKNRVTGILTVPGDHKSISSAILEMSFDKNLRESCINNARKIVEEEFDIVKNSLLKKQLFEKYS